MHLSLQFGYGMMEHSRVLVDRWGSGEVILSPRDLNETQLQRLSNDIIRLGGRVLLDPQCFLRDADHHRLTQHEYWQEFSANPTNAFLSGAAANALITALHDVAKRLHTFSFIIPSVLALEVNDDWFDFQECLINVASKSVTDMPCLATIALSSVVMQDEAQIESIIEKTASWDVDGYYIVPETPSAYLTDNPNWLANLLLVCAGLKLQERTVLVGYCNHQMLCLAAAGVDAIASGTWLNVRSFPTQKFYTAPEDEISRRAIWYYCPQAFSEYKLPFLDIAQRVGLLEEMKPGPSLDTHYAEALFSGILPSSIAWGETYAFRHYLACLYSQVESASKPTYRETVDHHHSALDNSEQLLTRLRRHGVRGQNREYVDFIDVNRSALAVLDMARGPLLSRRWNRLNA